MVTTISDASMLKKGEKQHGAAHKMQLKPHLSYVTHFNSCRFASFASKA